MIIRGGTNFKEKIKIKSKKEYKKRDRKILKAATSMTMGPYLLAHT